MSLRYMSRVGARAAQAVRESSGEEEGRGGEAEARGACAAHRHVPLRLGLSSLKTRVCVL
jgi:hypothetical protein